MLSRVIGSIALVLLAAASDRTATLHPLPNDDDDRLRLTVSGDVIRLTPSPQQQVSAQSCSNAGLVQGATVGAAKLPITLSVSRRPPTKNDYPYPCTLQVLVAGEPLSGTPDGLAYGSTAPSEVAFFSAEAYLIGPAPYALLVATAGFSAGDHDADVSFDLYVVRDGKLLDVAEGGSELFVTMTGERGTLTIKGISAFYDAAKYTSLADWGSAPPNTITFEIATAAGRVHWHGGSADGEKVVRQWLQEADPSFRAAQKHKEEADERASLAAQSQSQHPEMEERYLDTAEPSCMTFLRASRTDREGVLMSYIYQIEERLDEADAGRGCSSALGEDRNSVQSRSNAADFAYRMCSAEQNAELYGIARTMYGLDRSTSSMGLGDGCSRR